MVSKLDFALVVPIKHVLIKKVYKKLNFFYFFISTLKFYTPTVQV